MQIEAFQDHKTLTTSDLESLRIMVVDDESMICETLKLYFEKMGVAYVKTVDCGEKAVEEIKQNNFNYVFMDLMMPGISGIKTLERIREHNSLTSVIIMTGYPSMDIVIDALRNGASDFLVKPFRYRDIEIILERINRFQILMEKNLMLNKELEEKKEVEKLNKELKIRIKYQSDIYNIVDSFSRINKSEDLYKYLVTKSTESCNAKKACFLIYEEDRDLLVLSQQGLNDIDPGTRIGLGRNIYGKRVLKGKFIEDYFGKPAKEGIVLDRPNRNNGFMSIPFNIRNEPFGVLLVGEKEGKKSFNKDEEFILTFLAERTALNIENIALYDNLMQSLMASLMSLVSAIEAKDSYTQQHSSRVTKYSKMIARSMKCDEDDFQKIKTMAPIHDIGKIGIHDSILNKPGRLTEEEFNKIKTHPLIGVNIVSPLRLDSESLAIIRNHHERWDGKGYPDGLSKENIPKLARILSVADAFDAMNSSRAYRQALPFSECLNELKRNSGSQFDPDVVEAALSIFTI